MTSAAPTKQRNDALDVDDVLDLEVGFCADDGDSVSGRFGPLSDGRDGEDVDGDTISLAASQSGIGVACSTGNGAVSRFMASNESVDFGGAVNAVVETGVEGSTDSAPVLIEDIGCLEMPRIRRFSV